MPTASAPTSCSPTSGRGDDGSMTHAPAPGRPALGARHPLDNPILAALQGPHARFALRSGPVLRYQPDVAPFVAVADEGDPAAWEHLVVLGCEVAVMGFGARPPESWPVAQSLTGVQLVGTRVTGSASGEAVGLKWADVPQMLDLVARTRPGPFLPRTIALGTYRGIRHGGRLVAMAGERLRLPGYTEISAVCTDPEYRGLGLATRLILAAAAEITQRGDIPFLHAVDTNPDAIRLYQSLEFTVRRTVTFDTLDLGG